MLSCLSMPARQVQAAVTYPQSLTEGYSWFYITEQIRCQRAREVEEARSLRLRSQQDEEPAKGLQLHAQGAQEEAIVRALEPSTDMTVSAKRDHQQRLHDAHECLNKLVRLEPGRYELYVPEQPLYRVQTQMGAVSEVPHSFKDQVDPTPVR